MPTSFALILALSPAALETPPRTWYTLAVVVTVVAVLRLVSCSWISLTEPASVISMTGSGFSGLGWSATHAMVSPVQRRIANAILLCRLT